MKAIKHLFLAALTLAALTAGAWAQTQTATGPSAEQKQAAASATAEQTALKASDIQALKDGLAVALKQIQELKDELHHRDQAVQQAQDTAADAAAKANAAQLQAAKEQQTVGALQSDLADLKLVNKTEVNNATLNNAVLMLQDQAQGSAPAPEVFNKQMESPITIRFRGINITPGGYAAAEFVHRSRALGADLPTPFNNVTMPGASQSQMSEFFGSGRQSKITTFVDGRLGNVDLSSYVSADFLSAGVTSTSNETNSYTLRLRQAWAQAKFDNGWSFLGGQAWSLVTEDAVGISPDDDMGKTNDVRPKTIDPSYNVGFDFARQYGIRLTKSFGSKVAAAFALENPHASLTTHNNAANFLLGELGASNSYNTTASYSFNPSPDIVAKIAFDPGFGHYEIFGLLDRFTTRIFPCEDVASAVVTTYLCGNATSPGANALGAYNTSRNGGGVGASARWHFFDKRIVLGLKGFGGSGIGRYAPGGLSDVTILSTGTVYSATGTPESSTASLELLRNLHGLSTLEWHGKKVDIYAYGGAEYAGRASNYDPALGKYVGYGSPHFPSYGCYTETGPGTTTVGFTPGALGNCTADTRVVMEGTLGFWYRFYSGPRGRFQFGTQYSYLTRNTWAGASGGSTPVAGVIEPNGLDNMVFTSFRYYLP